MGFAEGEERGRKHGEKDMRENKLLEMPFIGNAENLYQ